MGIIGEGKRDLTKGVEQEIEAIIHQVAEIRARCRESAEDAQGLNGLAQALTVFRNNLEMEAGKLEDARDELLKKLGVVKDPIVTTVNAELTQRAIEASRAAKEVQA